MCHLAGRTLLELGLLHWVVRLVENWFSKQLTSSLLLHTKLLSCWWKKSVEVSFCFSTGANTLSIRNVGSCPWLKTKILSPLIIHLLSLTAQVIRLLKNALCCCVSLSLDLGSVCDNGISTPNHILLVFLTCLFTQLNNVMRHECKRLLSCSEIH